MLKEVLRSNRLLIVPVVLILALTILCLLIDSGVQHLQFGTLDRDGHRFGFNDPITLDHYRMMLTKSGGFWGSLWAHPYYALLLLMQFVNVYHLWKHKLSGPRRPLQVFAAQVGLFPVGLLTVWLLPLLLWELAKMRVDGETLTDFGPSFLCWFVVQPIWLMFSLVVFLKTRRQKLIEKD